MHACGKSRILEGSRHLEKKQLKEKRQKMHLSFFDKKE
jgi:hypothetical protein